MDHGMLDLVEPRENLRRTIRNLLELHDARRARGTRGRPSGCRRPRARRR